MATKQISKERELQIIEELRLGNGYFADAFTSHDFDRMASNVLNDYPLLMGTSVVDTKEYNRIKTELSKQVAANDAMRTSFDNAIDSMIVSGQTFSDLDLLRETIRIKGHGYVIKRKIELGLGLLDMDKEFLLNNL